MLGQAELDTEYFSIRCASDLTEADATTENFVVLSAVRFSGTRLIDNLSFFVK